MTFIIVRQPDSPKFSSTNPVFLYFIYTYMTSRHWSPFSVLFSHVVRGPNSFSSLGRTTNLSSFVHSQTMWKRPVPRRCGGLGRDSSAVKVKVSKVEERRGCGSTSLCGCNTTKPHALYLVAPLTVSSFFQSCLNSMSSGPTRKSGNQVPPTATKETRHSRLTYVACKEIEDFLTILKTLQSVK